MIQQKFPVDKENSIHKIYSQNFLMVLLIKYDIEGMSSIYLDLLILNINYLILKSLIIIN